MPSLIFLLSPQEAMRTLEQTGNLQDSFSNSCIAIFMVERKRRNSIKRWSFHLASIYLFIKFSTTVDITFYSPILAGTWFLYLLHKDSEAAKAPELL